MKFKVGDRIKLRTEYVGITGFDWKTNPRYAKLNEIEEIKAIRKSGNCVIGHRFGWELNPNLIIRANSHIIKNRLGIK